MKTTKAGRYDISLIAAGGEIIKTEGQYRSLNDFWACDIKKNSVRTYKSW